MRRALGVAKPHPRTAVGIADGGKRLVLVVVDGRSKEKAVGMSLKELAKVMLDLGCESALNLDGGGSTTLAIDGMLINRPSGPPPGQRPVGSALFLSPSG